MGGEEDAKPDRKRQHPLPDRHAWDDLINQVGSALSHAPGAARGAKPAPRNSFDHPYVCVISV